MLFRALAFLLLLPALVCGLEPSPIPVGYDAYRQWDRWPYQRIGARAYMRSTYDRRGGNEGADASHFLYQMADDKNVTLDVEGAGILYFVRYNHWHGSPWHYEIDGADSIVQESSTANPLHPATNSVFLPEPAFPNPLTWTWSLTKGADLSWVPIPFERSFRMAYSRTHYGTGYYIYHQFVRGTKLTHTIKSWKANDRPPKDVLALLASSGSDLVPAAESKAGRHLGLKQNSAEVLLAPGEPTTTALLTNGPAMLRALQFTVSPDQAIYFGRALLRVFWDDLPAPSIDVPSRSSSARARFTTGTTANTWSRPSRSTFVSTPNACI